MRDSCGICSLYTAEEEMDRMVLKSPVHGKLDSIVELKETVDEEQADTILSTDEEKKDDEVTEEKVPEEIRTPLSSDFTKIASEDLEDEDDQANQSRPQRDFDENPTQLYLTLMRKDWAGTIMRTGVAPDEVSTWIYRKEDSGKLRWKLLPIHASIIFGAPVSVLNSFLATDASTAMAADDQGMIPLHLAVRMGCPENIIRALVIASPKSTKSRDRKGRTPRDLALRQTGTVRERLLAALDGITEPAVRPIPAPVVVPAAPVVVVVEKQVVEEVVAPVFMEAPAIEEEEAKVPATEEAVVPAIEAPVAPVVQERATPIAPPSPMSPKVRPDPALVARVHLLELQLERSEASGKEIQIQLERLIAQEKRLRSEHNDLQEMYASATVTYVEAETANKAVISNLVNQVGDLQSKVTSISCEKTELQAELAHFKEIMDVERGEHKLSVLELERNLDSTKCLQQEAQETVERLETENNQLKTKLEGYMMEMTKLRETIAEKEIRLEEVTLSEQELAWKNSSLHETIKNMPDPVILDRQIENLEAEKKELKSTVHKLSVKLYKVVGFLDEMVQEQDAIIAESMQPTADDASSGAETADEDRQKLLTNVSGMKEQIGAIIESVLGNIPRVTDDEEEETDVES